MVNPLILGGVVSVAGIIAGAVGWYGGRGVSSSPHQPPPIPTRPALNLDNAIETILVKSLESQGAMFEKMQRLNIENAQLAMEAVQRNGFRRAGRKRANTARRTGAGKFAENCRLCEDAMISDPTTAEIIAHSQHRHRRRASAPVSFEDKGDHVEAHVDARDIEVGRDGVEQIECPDCGAHDHAQHRH